MCDVTRDLYPSPFTSCHTSIDLSPPGVWPRCVCGQGRSQAGARSALAPLGFCFSKHFNIGQFSFLRNTVPAQSNTAAVVDVPQVDTRQIYLSNLEH